jgi:predicted small secreted protein
MRIRSRLKYLTHLLSLAALGLTGCGGSDDGAGPDISVQGVDFDMLAAVLKSEFASVQSSIVLPGGAPGCATASGWQDTDGDGVPEEADVTFSASGCLFTFDGGSGTTSGSIHVRDPGAPFGFAMTLNALAYTMNIDAQGSSPAVTRVMTLNGDRTVQGSSTQVAMTQHVVLTYAVTGKATATANETWSGTFTPAQGSSVTFDAPLPDGGVVISGSLGWTQGGATIWFSLETTVPIRYAPGCNSFMPSAGEVHATVQSGGPDGYVRVVWSACGADAEVDFIGA